MVVVVCFVLFSLLGCKRAIFALYERRLNLDFFFAILWYLSIFIFLSSRYFSTLCLVKFDFLSIFLSLCLVCVVTVLLNLSFGMFVCLRFSWKLIHVKDIRCVCMRQFFSCNQTRQAHQYCNWFVSHLQYNVTMNNNNNSNKCALAHSIVGLHLLYLGYGLQANAHIRALFWRYTSLYRNVWKIGVVCAQLRLYSYSYGRACVCVSVCVRVCVHKCDDSNCISSTVFVRFNTLPNCIVAALWFYYLFAAREKERHTKTKIYM